MDDTPHHLSNKTSATPPPLSRGDTDWSQYCVVRLNEYQDMRDEIKQLRQQLAATRQHANNQAFIKETIHTKPAG